MIEYSFINSHPIIYLIRPNIFPSLVNTYVARGCFISILPVLRNFYFTIILTEDISIFIVSIDIMIYNVNRFSRIKFTIASTKVVIFLKNKGVCAIRLVQNNFCRRRRSKYNIPSIICRNFHDTHILLTKLGFY